MFGNFSLFKTPFLGWSSIPTSFVSLFVFYIFSYLLSKTMGCFSWCLMSSACTQKLFCGIYSGLKCSFDEFVGEKVVSLSYASAILHLPPKYFLIHFLFIIVKRCTIILLYLPIKGAKDKSKNNAVERSPKMAEE